MKFRLRQIVESFGCISYLSKNGEIRKSKKMVPMKEISFGVKPVIEGEDFFINPTGEEVTEIGRNGKFRFLALLPEKKVYVFNAWDHTHITFAKVVLKMELKSLLKLFYYNKALSGFATASGGKAIMISSDSFVFQKQTGRDYISFAKSILEDNLWIKRYLDCGSYLRKLIKTKKVDRSDPIEVDGITNYKGD